MNTWVTSPVTVRILFVGDLQTSYSVTNLYSDLLKRTSHLRFLFSHRTSSVNVCLLRYLSLLRSLEFTLTPFRPFVGLEVTILFSHFTRDNFSTSYLFPINQTYLRVITLYSYQLKNFLRSFLLLNTRWLE